MEKTVNSCLIEALAIMDTKGRRGHKDASPKSMMLWEKDWKDLRATLVEALFLNVEKCDICGKDWYAGTWCEQCTFKDCPL